MKVPGLHASHPEYKPEPGSNLSTSPRAVNYPMMEFIWKENVAVEIVEKFSSNTPTRRLCAVKLVGKRGLQRPRQINKKENTSLCCHIGKRH